MLFHVEGVLISDVGRLLVLEHIASAPVFISEHERLLDVVLYLLTYHWVSKSQCLYVCVVTC